MCVLCCLAKVIVFSVFCCSSTRCDLEKKDALHSDCGVHYLITYFVLLIILDLSFHIHLINPLN